MDFASPEFAGQLAGVVALVLCVIAFASKDDDRLLAILISGNVAFAVQFALFGAWVAAAISLTVIVRIILARRLRGHWPTMLTMLAITFGVAALGWQGPMDAFPLAAGVFGTVSMFMLRGIPMRIGLVGASICWIVTNAALGAIGALVAEVLMLGAGLVTIARLWRGERVARNA